MSLESPLILLLSPLALLPWFVFNSEKTVVWDAFLPHDPLSTVIDHAIKTLASAVILSLIVTVSGPCIPEFTKERLSSGAEFVILLDRSRSMDEPFAVTDSAQKVSRDLRKSKRSAAIKHLQAFVELRPDERWGFVMFSNKVMPLLPLTENKAAVLATILASGLGKGMSETNLAQSLLQAADYFDGEKYRGSRVVLLVSDGGETFSEDEKTEIRQTFQNNRLSLYWIYLKSVDDFALEKTSDEPVFWNERPERKLHTIFSTMNVPYQVFEADNDAEFFDAFIEINQHQSDSIIVNELQPKEPKADLFILIALVCLLPLVMIRLYALWGIKHSARS